MTPTDTPRNTEYEFLWLIEKVRKSVDSRFRSVFDVALFVEGTVTPLLEVYAATMVNQGKPVVDGYSSSKGLCPTPLEFE